MITPEEYKILKSFAQKIPDNDPGAHNNLAVVYYNKGLYDEAIAQLEKALQVDPGFVLARNNLQIVLQKSGRLEEKVKELGRAIETEPYDEYNTLELAETYRKLSRFSQAIIFYKKVLGYNPGSFEAHFGLGIVLKALGKYDDALEEMKRATEVKITPEAYRLMGEIYYNKGIIDLAIRNFQESLLLDGSSAEAHFYLGFALGEKGRHREGIEEVRKAIAINPALAQFEPNLPIDIRQHKGHLEFLKEQLGIPKTSVNEFQVHLNMADSYIHKGLFNEAKREIDECLRVNPREPRVLLRAGEIAIFLGQNDDAIRHLEECFKVDDSAPRCANSLGVGHLRKNDYVNAKAWFERALALDKEYAPAYNNLAVTAFCRGDIESALKYLELGIKANEAAARYNQGMYYFRTGDYDRALKTAAGESADDHFIKGLVYNEIGREGESIEAFRRVLALAPGYAGAYYNIGFNLMKSGNYEEGLSYIRKGMGIEPNYEKDKYRLSVAPELHEFGPYYVAQVTKEMLLDEIEEIEEIFPKARSVDFDALLAQAESYLQANDIDRARSLIEQALQMQPASTKAIVIKAQVLHQSGNAEEAVQLLTDAVQQYPDEVALARARAELLAAVGRLKDAQGQYQRLITAYGEQPDYLRELANLHFQMNEFEEAQAFYQRLRAQQPGSVDANLGLLKVALRKKDIPAAGQCIELLEKEHVGSYEYNVYAGIYWLEVNQRPKAEQHLRRAIDLDPSKPLPYYHLGLIRVQQGEFDKACDDWKKALLLSPDEELSEKITHCLKITMEMLEFLKKEI